MCAHRCEWRVATASVISGRHSLTNRSTKCGLIFVCCIGRMYILCVFYEACVIGMIVFVCVCVRMCIAMRDVRTGRKRQSNRGCLKRQQRSIRVILMRLLQSVAILMTRPASGGCSVMRVHDDDADAGGRALRCLFNKLSPIRYAHFVRTLLFNAHARQWERRSSACFGRIKGSQNTINDYLL